MLLACRNLAKTFVDRPVLKGGYFHIEEKEKAAIVGINGAGKSTLLNLITGRLAPDEGEIILTKGKSLGYLTQHQDLTTDKTVYEEIASAKADIFALEEEIRTLEQQISGLSGEALEEACGRYGRLTQLFEEKNGYAAKSEIVGVLKGLGFTEAEYGRPAGLLSGGEKTRLALGKLLLTAPDLILLDEPTNHLDIASVAWLEGYLRDYPGAVLVVSHDRYFLDRVVTKVIEVEAGEVTMYTGNYSAFAVKKQQLRDIALKAYYNQQAEIKHQEEVITKLKSFNREKSIKRAESREKMLAKLDRLEKPEEVNDSMHFTLSPHVLSGEEVLTLSHIGKSFGETLLFAEVNELIHREEHVALIGDNGSGKSTLLKIINGLLAPDCGEIKLGAQVRIGYYDQEQQLLTDGNTLFEEIREAYPAMTDTLIRNTLAAFLFTGDDVFKLVGELSGGERGRLSLAKLMLSPCNFLILDEPTNHLDMASREILENAIRHYSGTVLVVSHDRYFINRIATRTLELADQTLRSTLGGYDDYLAEKAKREALQAEAAAAAAGPAAVKTVQTDSARERQLKKEADAERRRREKELSKTEELIEETEGRIAEIDGIFGDPEVARDAARLMALQQEKDELNARLEELYGRWEELN